MKERRQYRRTLTLAVTLLIAVNIGLSVTPLSAESGLKRGEWKTWEGIQSCMPVQVEIHKLRIAGRNVEIYGAIMMGTLDGYEFDGTYVGYEIIHYMKIYGLDDYALELLKTPWSLLMRRSSFPSRLHGISLDALFLSAVRTVHLVHSERRPSWQRHILPGMR